MRTRVCVLLCVRACCCVCVLMCVSVCLLLCVILCVLSCVCARAWAALGIQPTAVQFVSHWECHICRARRWKPTPLLNFESHRKAAAHSSTTTVQTVDAAALRTFASVIATVLVCMCGVQQVDPMITASSRPKHQSNTRRRTSYHTMGPVLLIFEHATPPGYQAIVITSQREHLY